LKIHHIIGNTIPSPTLDWTNPIVFIPDSPNYPSVDFLLFDKFKSMLIASQITIQVPIRNHKKSVNFFRLSGNPQIKPDDQWKHNSGGKIANVIFLWLGVDTTFNAEFNGHYYVDVRQLNPTLFPLAQLLQL